MSLNETFAKVQAAFARDFTQAGLKALIVGWAIFIAVLALTIDNKFLLAGILAYEILP